MKKTTLIFCLSFLSFFAFGLPGNAQDVPRSRPLFYESRPAKELFGVQTDPSPLAARSIGSYARGCLAGATRIEKSGRYWQAMRLSRNRRWGHPALIAYLKSLAQDAALKDGWNGLLVGDLSQPRGGPMLTGHASHQIGLDADVWLSPMPARLLSEKEREDISAVSMLKKGTRVIDNEKFSLQHKRLIRRAASFDEVARIFVHPAIKQALCKWTGDRVEHKKWQRKVRPWYGHHYHFHIRLKCPDKSAGCQNQSPPPSGNGCGKALDWWLSDAPWQPAKPAKKPVKKAPLTLRELPKMCRAVLTRHEP